MRRVDDPLVEVVGPWMGAHRSQAQSHAVDQREEPRRGARAGAATASAKVSERPERISISEAISSPAAESASTSSRLAGRVDVLEAVLELERARVEDRELLLEPDREVGRGLESLAGEVEVEGQGAQAR